MERVEKMLRAPLKDSDFELDGEETRRYLRFTNGVFDLEEMRMRKPTPEMRLTNSTEWAYEGSGVSREIEDRLKQVLRKVKEEEQQDDAGDREADAAEPAERDALPIRHVEQVEHARPPRPNLRCEAYALRLPARQRCRASVE